MKEEKVYVKVLEPGRYYSMWFDEGETLLCWLEHAEEWEQMGRVKILRSQTDVFVEAAKNLIKNMPVTEIQILLEGAIYEVSKEQMGRDVRGKIGWMEELRKRPMRDGRKRTIDLVFIPYCKNVLGLDEEKTVEWITTWLRRCEALSPTDIGDRTIRQKYRRTPDAAA